jgi:brefeldin A-resistance guanine nucleotide exchange factor 1
VALPSIDPLLAEPLSLFEPFLEIVRSESTSGLVTDAALNAVIQLLDMSGILREGSECEEVLELVAEAGTHCRFESSPGDDGDEVVLHSILKLLKHTLCHPLGARLEDETVFGMVEKKRTMFCYFCKKKIDRFKLACDWLCNLGFRRF